MGKNRRNIGVVSSSEKKSGLQIPGYEFYDSPNKTSKEDTYSENDGYPYINYKEITDKDEFIRLIKKNKSEGNPRDEWRVFTPSLDELDGVKMYVTNFGTTFGIKDGVMVSLSSAKNSNGDSLDNMRAINELARKVGGKTFDSFSGNWNFYLHNGYVPTKFDEWDHKYDNEMMKQGWNPKLDDTEPVIYFKYDPDQAREMVSNKVSAEKWMAENKDKMI